MMGRLGTKSLGLHNRQETLRSRAGDQVCEVSLAPSLSNSSSDPEVPDGDRSEVTRPIGQEALPEVGVESRWARVRGMPTLRRISRTAVNVMIIPRNHR